MMPHFLSCFAIMLTLGFAGLVKAQKVPEKPTEAQLAFFETKVRPLLVKHCYECHSAKSKELKGGLRVDSRQRLLKGGDSGPAIEPFNEKSLFIDAIEYGDLYQMPPKYQLADSDVSTFIQWIKMGAPWPPEKTESPAVVVEFDLAKRMDEHWIWQGPKLPRPPRVNQKTWPQQELDRFILAKLEDHHLQPSQQADRVTLIRRAYFDVIGLPPTPTAVQDFINDPESTETAFEKVIDQLLASDHYGERWARHWMDLVRYSESYGHEFDYTIPHAYHYRDYLIRAFNEDIPYDQFITEQIAGDLMPSPRLSENQINQSLLGTGFWWMGEAVHAPVDVVQDEADRIDNQIDVLGKTFLGVTVGCARCHDHKFDAISTKDYYALAGFLQSSRRDIRALYPEGTIKSLVQQMTRLQMELSAEVASKISANTVLDGKEFSRFLLAVREAHRRKLQFDKAPDETKAIAAEFNIPADKLQLWFPAVISKETDPVQHPLHLWRKTMDVPAKDLNGHLQAAKKQSTDGLRQTADILKNSPQLDGFEQWATQWYIQGESFPIRPTPSGTLDLRGEVLQLFKTGSIHSGQLSNKLQGSFRSPTFDLNHNAIQMKLRGNGVESRLIVDGFFMYRFNGLLFRGFSTTANSPDSSRWHRLQGDISRYKGHTGYVEFLDQGNGSIRIDDIRFTNEGSPPEIPTPLLQKLVTPELDSHEAFALSYGRQWENTLKNWHTGQLNDEDVDLINWAFQHKLIEVPGDIHARINEQWQHFRKLDSEIPKHEHVLVMADGNAENENIFIRGNHKVPGETAPRQLLSAIVGEKTTQSSGSGRLELAADIADANNALTSRVMVNRIWHHLFGRGIVASTNNFGVLGQRPTHPKLLDHLARQFSDEHQWSVKDMIREIMLSSTYQLSSIPNSKYRESDPNNFLLYRQNIRRLEGEVIRDHILAVSGRLDKTMYGPSMPVYLTPFMSGRGRPKTGPLDGAGRRSIYISVRRNFISPMMLAFDTPVPFNSIGRRNVSNVPSQALILMNDPFVIEQSQVWAKRLATNDQQTPGERVDQMIREAFGRPATKTELADAADFLEIQREQYAINAENLMTDIRLWADLGHVLINSKPFIYID